MSIDRLVREIDIAALADDLRLEGRGDRRRYCPSCQPNGGKTPDLAIYDTGPKGRWTCFKCGAQGDAVDLVALARGCDVRAAVEYLKGCGRPLSERAMVRRRDPDGGLRADGALVSRVLLDFLKRCAPAEGTATETYWAGRGIPLGVLRQMGVRHCAARRYTGIHRAVWSGHGSAALTAAGLAPISRRTGGTYLLAWAYERDGIDFCVLPYIDGERVVALKLRPLMGKAEAEARGVTRFLATARSLGIFNVNALEPGQTVIVCEGESDTLTAIASGVAAVGVPGASVFRRQWVQRFAGVDVVFCFDADETGRQGLRKVAGLFAEAGLPTPRAIRLGDGMDLNDVIGGRNSAYGSESVPETAPGVPSGGCELSKRDQESTISPSATSEYGSGRDRGFLNQVGGRTATTHISKEHVI